MHTSTVPFSYTEHEVIVDARKVNLYLGLLFVPAFIIFASVFFLVWSELFSLAHLRLYFQENIDRLKASIPWIIFGSLIAGIIAHELLHGITWARFAKHRFKSIRFGFHLKSLTPYCHCVEPLPVMAYKLGALMPGLALGIFPLVVAFVTGHVGLFLFGFSFTVAAGGDFAVVFLLRKESGDVWIQDHPSKIGCVVYRKK